MACSSPARMPETKTLSLIASCEPALCTRSDGFLSMYGLDALADCRPTIICDYGPARREGVVKGCNHTTWAGGVRNGHSHWQLWLCQLALTAGRRLSLRRNYVELEAGAGVWFIGRGNISFDQRPTPGGRTSDDCGAGYPGQRTS